MRRWNRQAKEPSIRRLDGLALETFGAGAGCDVRLRRHELHESIVFGAEAVNGSGLGKETQRQGNKSTPHGG